MNRREYEDAIDEIAVLELRRARLLAQEEEATDQQWREHFCQWIDSVDDEIGKRKDAIWDAIVRGDVGGELPL